MCSCGTFYWFANQSVDGFNERADILFCPAVVFFTLLRLALLCFALLFKCVFVFQCNDDIPC